MQPSNPGTGSESPVGSGNVTVEQGDCVFSIALEHGLSWRTIWDHPENADLVDVRGSPHVLLPGDQLFVPDITPKVEDGGTGSVHKFRLKEVPLDFAIEVLDNNRPRAGLPFKLTIEGRTTEGVVPGDGIVRTKIWPSDRQGELVVGEGKEARTQRINLGDLDPVHTRSGAAARLLNMGYTESKEPDDEEFALGLKIFQSIRGLERTGELDAATIEELSDRHGS